MPSRINRDVHKIENVSLATDQNVFSFALHYGGVGIFEMCSATGWHWQSIRFVTDMCLLASWGHRNSVVL